MPYSEAELSTARQEATAFCSKETQDNLMTMIVEGRAPLYRMATELLEPIYFEVDEAGTYTRNLDSFLLRAIGFEDTRRRDGLVKGSPLTILVFEKTNDEALENEDDGKKKLREFCRQFLVSQLARADPKKVVVNLLIYMLNARTETERNHSKQMLIEIVTQTEEKMRVHDWVHVNDLPSAKVCAVLSNMFFGRTCTDEFTDAAIEIMAVVSERTHNISILLRQMAWTLENPDERKRSEDLFIRFGKRAHRFGDASSVLRKAIASDNEDVSNRATGILVTVAEARCVGKDRPQDEILFLMEMLNPLVNILHENENVRTAYARVVGATNYPEEGVGQLLLAMEKEDLVAAVQTTLLELASINGDTTRTTGRKCVGQFNVGTSNRSIDEYNNRLIGIAVKFVNESKHWRTFIDGIVDRLVIEQLEMHEKAIAFCKGVIDKLEEREQNIVIKRLVIGFSDEKTRVGTARLFDRLIADGGVPRQLAVNAITKEMFGLRGQKLSGLESGLCEYLEQRERVANRVSAHLTALAREKPEVRTALVESIGSQYVTIRDIAIIAHNLSTPGKIGTIHAPRAGTRIPNGTPGGTNGRVHT